MSSLENEIPLIGEATIYTPKIKELKVKELKIKNALPDNKEASKLAGDISDLMDSYKREDINTDNKIKSVLKKEEAVVKESKLMESMPDVRTCKKTEKSYNEISDSFDNIIPFENNSSDKSFEDMEERMQTIINKAKDMDKNALEDDLAEESINKKVYSKSKKKKRKKIIYNTVMTILVCIFVGCAAYLINYYVQTKRSEDKFHALAELIIVDEDEDGEEATEYVPVVDNEGNVKPPAVVKKPKYVQVDGRKVLKKYSELYRRNHDFYGWLTIGDTVINYPVMYTPREEDYYLHRDFDRDYSDPGSLFIDASCDVKTPGDNLIIYGHNMLSGKMFASLLNYENEEYYRKYKYIQFNTIDSEGVYEVIAAFRAKIEKVEYKGFKYYTFFNAKKASEFDDYVYNCRSRTPYNTSSAEYGDKLITLSTCAYHSETGRYVVVAKKIK